MDFWIDIGFAVLLRLLKDRRESPKWKAAFLKLRGAIDAAFPPDSVSEEIGGQKAA
jgi:hypothetical protein